MAMGGGTGTTDGTPSGAMVMGSSESSLSVREALLAMLISYLETRGFQAAGDFQSWPLLNDFLDALEEVSFSPRYAIKRIEAEYQKNPPEVAGDMNWLMNALDVLIDERHVSRVS